MTGDPTPGLYIIRQAPALNRPPLRIRLDIQNSKIYCSQLNDDNTVLAGVPFSELLWEQMEPHP